MRQVASFVIPTPTPLEATPIVYGGSMYVSSTNSVYAFNLVTGTLTWSFSRPQTPGVAQDAGTGFNRGVAMSPSSIFLATDNAHLIALNINTGALQWETTMADYTQNYGATAAPLYLSGPNLVISGISGGDSGVRGFVAAYNATTGAPVWTFYTTPGSPGDPTASSWGNGSVLPHGCGATWMTGSYDATLNLLYWGVGNPCPLLNDSARAGSDLYTSSVVALNPSTGSLQWYYQLTPDDVWDYDGAMTPVLADMTWQGQARHLLFEASRNGFFYVLDRTNGKFLAATPFVTNLNWAFGINPSGQPIVNPAARPSATGAQVCPSQRGANNWQSTAFNPGNNLFFVNAVESCSIYTSYGTTPPWAAGDEYTGGIVSPVAGIAPQKHLRAINPATGAITWDIAEPGYGWSFGGVLATAGGLVFYGDDAGALTAANANTGATLWTYKFQAPTIKSSPMTFELNGQQYIAVAAPLSISIFGLPQSSSALSAACPANVARAGSSYTSSIASSGGKPPYSYSLAGGGLPAGLSLNRATGGVAGVPQGGGIFQYAVQVSDSSGTSAGVTTPSCGITVNPLPVVLTCPVPTAPLGTQYGSAIPANGGTPPYTFSISAGTLPPGVSLNAAAGQLTGIPVTGGTFNFQISVKDSTGSSAGAGTVQCQIAAQ